MRIPGGDRLRRRFACVALAIGAVACSIAVSPRVGAMTPRYLVLAGQRLTCDDLLWATSRGLIEPVEVHWLWDQHQPGTDYGCETQFLVMLARGARGDLTCADIEWNTAWNQLRLWYEVADLLTFVPGCRLSTYAVLVEGITWFAIDGEYFASCSDINWHYQRGLITPEQADWLRAVLNVRNVPCPLPSSPPANASPTPDGAILVDYLVTPNAPCYYEYTRYGYAADGGLQQCVVTTTGMAWKSP